MVVLKNRTKIVATIGPASAKKEVLVEMIKAGLSVCRVNFSHGSYDVHKATIDLVREINEEYGFNVGVLADLQGPKIRIGDMKDNGVAFKKGDVVEIQTKNKIVGDKDSIYMTYMEFPKDVNPGEIFLLDDGKMQMRVLETNKVDSVKAEVLYDGILSSKKGVNLPFTKTSTPALTQKDKEDLEFALSCKVEWIGLSFVREAKDIVELRSIIEASGSKAGIIAKIEKPEAIENMDAIIEVTDGIMVARGDLGVEIPMEQVPVAQKQMVYKCRRAGKPCIIATQMMDSMVTNPRPTRAEANDVANSVLDGADAVMLSNETSVGAYPIATVEAMSAIIANIESSELYPYFTKGALHDDTIDKDLSLAIDICRSSVILSEKTHSKAIVSMSWSGYSAYQISSHRPKGFTYVFTNNKEIVNRLSLIWGVKAFFYDKTDVADNIIQDVNSILTKGGYIEKGDVVINTASVPAIQKGRTNAMKISII